MAILTPLSVRAAEARRIKWSELIPGNLPYAEIIGRGRIDTDKDIWVPEFDANGSQLNTDLDGQRITLAGYILPLEIGSEGVSEFVLVPYVGACIHTPPPPPNQLLFVTSVVPWPQGNLWDAVLVTGVLQAQPLDTEVANIGYQMQAEYIEPYRA
ncbi:MAG: hypothetical protein BM562_12115 [Alphaproteobacteria bacterium MedPE-SWcel]|nr:MAG: hypothetical protein BM562_12115 [Alphaproteobacteria bacterium MedPE-SWcel]